MKLKHSEFRDLTAVIAIGGKGTRLKAITKNIPKPLFPINKISTLFRICMELKEYGITEIVLTLGYCESMFDEEIQFISSRLGLKIKTFKENNPLGECGALWHIKKFLKKDVIFVNGDLVFSIDLKRFVDFHQRINSRLTLLTHTSTHPEDSDLVSAPNGSLIKKLHIKSDENHPRAKAYLGNAGMALFDSELLDIIPAPKSNHNSSFFNYLALSVFSKKILIFSYNTSEYIKDMGTEKRFRQVEQDLKKGIVEKKCYKNPQKALFLDRDNTLIKCEDKKYVIDSDKLEFMDYEIKRIAKISKNYDVVCMVTNQPQISMGFLNIDRLDSINSKIIKYCLSLDLKIDVVSFCPHHPHAGFENELNFLKKDCFCRKPNPGMILELSYSRNINLPESLLIGDSDNDLNAALNAGCKFLFVNQL